MGDVKGFLKFGRLASEYRPVCERIKDFSDAALLRSEERSKEQASRCMDCGTPFCHWGCPIGNYIPEWNDLMFRGRWKEAFRLLEATNNLAEITGRLCPAPCEHSCVLGINDDAVTIRENELAIIEHAFNNGLINLSPPKKRTKKRIAVIGSGPAGLACADQLNKAGHKVCVFEKDDRIGGILRYGIPDFKLEKWVLERRIDILKKGGIEFSTGVEAALNISVSKLKNDFDAICLAGGSRTPRDLEIEGRSLKGIHFAMDYLIQANRRARGERIIQDELIDAKDKKVVVIGGGDTGADCVGVAHRQGAKCVIQIELLPKPEGCRNSNCPWPRYPLILKTSTSHEEGGERHWSVLTKRFIGDNGGVKKLSCVKVEFKKSSDGCPMIKEVEGSGFEIDADLVILAMGFIGQKRQGLIESLRVELDSNNNIKTDANFMTSVKKVFSCGDMRKGQSWIVWAISEGRMAAYHIDKFLMGQSALPMM